MDAALRRILYIYALENAAKHGSVPRAKAVMGKVLGTHPELRPHAKELPAALEEVLAEVATMAPEAWKAKLAELAPEVVDEMDAGKKKETKKELPPLEEAEDGVVMRFAPNPSGPLHLGHARAAFLNDAYVKRYGGRYVLRIEDTDPRRVDPDAYRMVQEDIEWMGLGVTDIVYQSDRMDIYYDLCRKLIEIGGAYVCTCDAGRFRELKLAKKACPCRAHTVEENLELWEQMLSGGFAEGQVTVRVKTDLEHPDPAIRDFSIFRIVDSPAHPRIEAKVYPLMNFSVVVDDHLLGITHVIRGKDHIANTRRQRYIFDYFGWKPPVYRHYGRMSIEGLVLSTSSMHQGIDEGTYTGWDDVHLGTLRAIARRGIQPEAVRRAMVDLGTGDTDISFSWENLYAQNKAVIDETSDRFFFVPNPVRYEVEGAPEQRARVPLYPGDEKRGVRELAFTSAVVLPAAEVEGAGMVRLKDLFNIELKGEGQAAYAGDDLAAAREAKAPIIQWLPAEYGIPCTLRTPEGDIAGVCEPEVTEHVGGTVQFERVGFARIDRVEDGRVVAFFAHR
ncbi:glutamate--tRNA ligase [Methanofollis formosanus]|uniref:Glutamate--tRNA ligase n=1 Tax=Methanofollis formosanus TaxID=299308 RepID=A0A8G1A3F7_9EURY|nr:glutamate--tRNA ligase [Methanofollis formosanus]QYZ79689.1 glutamate--tRNA ligase [Methanofollis formosanus]